MNINKIKTVILCILMSTSVYQASELWFDSGSSRNFFYSFFGQTFLASSKNIEKRPIYLAKPNRIFINTGTRRFIRVYDGKAADEIENMIEQGMKQILQNGTYVESGPLDWSRLLTLKSYIYEYSVDLPIQSFTREFGQRSIEWGQKTMIFQYIVWIPGRSMTEETEVFFINDKESIVHRVKIGGSKLTKAIYDQMESVLNENRQGLGRLEYLSSSQNNFEIFKENVFLCDISRNHYLIPQITVVDPFVVDGELNYQELEAFVDDFFDVPAAKRTRKDPPNLYTYADENIVVKYFPTGVVEYINYNIREKSMLTSLENAYETAIKFLSKDRFLQGQLSLVEMEQSEEGWLFYFDFYIEGFPFVMSEKIKEQTDMKHAVEVLVQHGKVKRYRHYVKVFEPRYEATADTNVDFSAALDQVLEGRKQTDEFEIKVQNMFLGYYQENENKQPGLRWFIEIKDEIFTVPAVK